VNVDELSGQDLDINISGFGALNMPKLAYKSLNVQLSGSGSVIAGGQADRLNVQISGAGSFNAPELRSLEANVQISGVGRAVVWASEKLSSGISGLGSVGYYGSPSPQQKHRRPGPDQQTRREVRTLKSIATLPGCAWQSGY
jgi:hypothetical protein